MGRKNEKTFKKHFINGGGGREERKKGRKRYYFGLEKLMLVDVFDDFIFTQIIFKVTYTHIQE